MAKNKELSKKNQHLNSMLESLAAQNKRQLLEITYETEKKEIDFKDAEKTWEMEAANMQSELCNIQENFKEKFKMQKKIKEELENTIQTQRILKEKETALHNEEMRILHKKIKKDDAIKKYLEQRSQQ